MISIMSMTKDHRVTFLSSNTTIDPDISGADPGIYAYQAEYLINDMTVRYNVTTHRGSRDYVYAYDLVDYFRDNGIVSNALIDGYVLEMLYGLSSCQDASAEITMVSKIKDHLVNSTSSDKVVITL